MWPFLIEPSLTRDLGQFTLHYTPKLQKKKIFFLLFHKNLQLVLYDMCCEKMHDRLLGNLKRYFGFVLYAPILPIRVKRWSCKHALNLWLESWFQGHCHRFKNNDFRICTVKNSGFRSFQCNQAVASYTHMAYCYWNNCGFC